MTILPEASIVSAPVPSTRTVFGSLTATIRPPATRMSRSPSGSGAKTLPPRMRVIMVSSVALMRGP